MTKRLKKTPAAIAVDVSPAKPAASPSQTEFPLPNSVLLSPTYARRSPDWRFRRATWLLDQGRRLGRGEDPAVARLHKYLVARRDRRPLGRFADLVEAEGIRDGDGVERALVEAHLLAGRAADEVARRTGLPVSAVSAYESSFFDVSGRLSMPSWVMNCVIQPFRRGPLAPDEAERLAWRIAGFHRADLLDLLLETAFMPPPLAGDDAAFFDWTSRKVRYGVYVWSVVGDESGAGIAPKPLLRLYDRLRRLEIARLRRLGAGA